mmetsp:Transcript_2394/g.3376  ORF Transcript_2394/g.3376 Transcript_2394/m.3376 type:complete len:100 (-) Transcript_2394:327-626(-)
MVLKDLCILSGSLGIAGTYTILTHEDFFSPKSSAIFGAAGAGALATRFSRRPDIVLISAAAGAIFACGLRMGEEKYSSLKHIERQNFEIKGTLQSQKKW